MKSSSNTYSEDWQIQTLSAELWTALDEGGGCNGIQIHSPGNNVNVNFLFLVIANQRYGILQEYD